MFTSMLQSDMSDDFSQDDMSDELKELIDDFVNSIYDSIDADRSGSLEFDEACGPCTSVPWGAGRATRQGWT